MSQHSELFLSYRRADSPDTVQLIFEKLKAKLPRWDIFFDHRSLAPGEPFSDSLRQKVAAVKVVLVVIGPRWLAILKERRGEAVDHVREEVRMALESGNTVVPVCVGNTPMPTEADLAEFPELRQLCALNNRTIRPEPDFDPDLDRVVLFLEQIGPGVGVGTVLGNKYKLVQLIGEGGMGIVFLAEQLSPKRQVAIKLIKPGMDSKEILARFDAERQALAVMDHANICRVLDAGKTADDRPYFVMDYVRGQSITAYCDDKRLTPNERLSLFRPVCEAVQHAHQKGILHRDIKPSNVLVEVVDGKPVPKVIDFGLAKALSYRLTDRTLVSEFGKTVGTLIYSSPEQAAGRTHEIDTRTDIYSLGILLYELLAGAPPFTEADLARVGEAAIRDEIIKTDPGAPSTNLSSSHALPLIAANRRSDPSKLTKQLRGELDWIVMKALEKEPDRRYASATSFADDLERYLNHEPISVGRPSTRHRLVKFYRRNKVQVIAGELIFLTLIAGIVATLLAFFEAKRQEGIAQEESGKKEVALRDEERQRKLAEQRFAEKREAMDEMLEQFGDKKLSALPGTQEIRKVLFARGVEQYESMFREKQLDGDVQRTLIDRYLELGQLQSEVGTLASALEPLYKAEAILRASAEREPDGAEIRFRLGKTLYQIGQCHWEHQSAAAGQPALREAVEILTGLGRTDSANPEYARFLAMAQTRLATTLADRSEERDRLDLAAYTTLKELARAHPTTAIRLAMARVAVNRAGRKQAQSKLPEAEALYGEALGLADSILQTEPEERPASTVYQLSQAGLAENYRKTGREQKGVELLTGAVGEFTKLSQANPAVPHYQELLVYTLNQLRRMYQQLNKNDLAIQALRDAIRLSEGLAQRNPRLDRYPVNAVYYSLTMAEIQRNNRLEAESAATLDQVIRQADALMKLHPKSAGLLRHLQEVHQKRAELAYGIRQFDVARECAERGVGLYARSAPALGRAEEGVDYHYFKCFSVLLDVAVQEKKTGVAAEIITRLVVPFSLDRFENASYRQELLALWNRTATIYEDVGKASESLKLRERVVAEAKKLLDGDPTSNWYTYQLVFGSHEPLLRLYRKTDQPEKEFRSLRDQLGEFESYVKEKDHSALLNETRAYTPENLKRLRDANDVFSKLESLKRFTIPIVIDGAKYPFPVFVCESRRFVEDQFKWIRTVRKGEVPKEVEDSFLRLHKIARDNKVSYADLCVYALGVHAEGPADAKAVKMVDAPVVRSTAPVLAPAADQRIQELTRARKQYLDDADAPAAKKGLIIKLVKMSEDELAHGNLFRAGYLLDDARALLKIDSFERLADPKDGEVFNYFQFIQAVLLAQQGQLEKADQLLRQSMDTADFRTPAEYKVDAGKREYALGWVCRELKRPIEAAVWYRQAVKVGFDAAAPPLYRLLVANAGALRVLPVELITAHFEALAEATKEIPAETVFAKKLSAIRIGENRLVLFQIRNRLLLGAMRTLESDPKSVKHQAALRDAYEELADSHVVRGESADAFHYFRKAIETQALIPVAEDAKEATRMKTLLLTNKAGLAALKLKQFQAAIDQFRACVAIARNLRADAPKNPKYQREIFIALYNIGSAQDQAKQPAAALETFEAALAASKECEKPDTIARELADLKMLMERCKAQLEKPKAPASRM